ncbi:hypothetical protein COO60DRAFT_1645897 [Scenedesmus sp. NREL 46B-D3]|nr:hypothetical protein COO60DRAFT_1645897 [Scenedesmus sp. NREL 46B-D3]
MLPLPQAAAAAASSSSRKRQSSDALSPGEEFDVVVIGAGIGGLSCAALLAYYGFKAMQLAALPLQLLLQETSLEA